VGRPRKVDDETLEQIREWHDAGLSYSAIATLVEDIIGEPIDQSTIYRYCKGDD
jgi:intein-encoded DNA endonuclease-like protein